MEHFKIIFWSPKIALDYYFRNICALANKFTMITYVALVLGLISGSSSSFSDSSSKSNMASNFIPSNSNSPEDKLYALL